MYRIKQDKRVLASAGKMKKGLLVCLKSKAFNDISVSDITRASGVCRATFYRIFDTPTDVLAYTCDSYAEKLIREIKEKRGSMNRDSFLRFILTNWMENAEVIEAIMKSGRYMVLNRSLQIVFNDIISFGNRFTEDEKDYIRSSLAAQFGSILFVWVQHGRKESAGFLLRLFRRFATATSASGDMGN